MNSRSRNRRLGMSMLEIVLSAAMLSTIVAAVSVLTRTSYNAWKAHDDDLTQLESAHATLRHIVREFRQATAVTELSNSPTPTIKLLMTDATTHVWQYDGADQTVQYGVTTADTLLSENIKSLSFTGYQTDGTTVTTVAADIRVVKITVTVDLPRDPAVERTVSCYAWLRSW